MKTKILSILALLLMTVTQGAWAQVTPNLAGEGTQASPYLIASTTDWNNLSAAVNGGETYSGNYFKMTANVGTVATTVDTSTNAFNGTFDGNGHTLNVNISNSNVDTRTAPFAWAGGSAVIKNLHENRGDGSDDPLS